MVITEQPTTINLERFGGPYIPGQQLYDNISAIMQPGFTSKHNLSAEGGTDKVTIRASVSMLDQDGVVKTSDAKRFNLSLSGWLWSVNGLQLNLQ